jgi:BirA family biotin operon repressor/biotin-[acetyl-CoA-carboxylase] ligase
MKLDERYRQFLQEDNELLEDYNRYLFRRMENVRFRKDNVVFQATVMGASVDGQLIVRDAIEKRFDFGEVEWVL